MGITCCKGMRDILPAEMDSWYYLENIAFRLVEAYGYREIRTPLFESKELFTNCMGRDSGTVQNKLWTVKGNNGESWALRPDMTASTLRAYCEHRLYLDASGPTKLFYLGPVFQHSSGRKSFNWQGYQFGLEALGTEDPSSDVEVIMMANDLCQELGLPKVRVHINTLGCAHCRPVYQQMLSDFFARHSSELCSACLNRYKNRPLWVLGCPEERCRNLSSIVPSIHSCLCEECEAHFKAVCSYLSELKVDYVVDPLVVRDVDFYTRTVFQVVCAGHLVALGGRYDGMAARIAGTDSDAADISAVGCSMDVEPLLNLMDEMNIGVKKYSSVPKVCFAGDSCEAVQLILPVLYALRRSGIAAELKVEDLSSEDSLPKISSARFVVGLQDADVRNRVVMFFDGETERSERMSLDEALTIIGREFAIKNLPAELRPSDVRNWSIATRSHHTLDGGLRLRRTGETKTRSRSRRLSLKTEQLLPTSMRESRVRKNTAYSVPVTRDKTAASRVRKRRRPEAEDSLETAAVEPMDDFLISGYPEPKVAAGKREKRDLELTKPAGSHHLSGIGKRVESISARERSSEGLLNGRADKLKFSDVESLVYGRSVTGKQRLDVHRDLYALGYGAAADSERIFYHSGDEFEDILEDGNTHDRRRMHLNKDGYRSGYPDGRLTSEYADAPFEAAARSGGEKSRPNIIQNINRWASERYGIAETQETEAVLSLKATAPVRKDSSGRSRKSRQSLARNRELKALAASNAESDLHEVLPSQDNPETKKDALPEADRAQSDVHEPQDSQPVEAETSSAETAASADLKAAPVKRRSSGVKRRSAERLKNESAAAVGLSEMSEEKVLEPAETSSQDAVEEVHDISKSDAEKDVPLTPEDALPASVPTKKRSVSARRTAASRRTASSPRRSSGKKAAAVAEKSDAEIAGAAVSGPAIDEASKKTEEDIAE